LIGRLAERLGFKAIYLSGAVVSACKALPDIGLITLSELLDLTREVTQATSLPLLCDVDTGFGEPLNVERTVRLLESAGAAGIHLEDQQMPKRCGHLSGKRLIEPEVMVSKIRAAVNARRDPDFMIMARTDARGVTSFGEAVDRAGRYIEAGADAIFPEAMQSAEEFAAFARAINSPVLLLANMTEFGKSPLLSVAELGAMGYRLVLYPVTTLRIALRAVEDTLRNILTTGHQRDSVDGMTTRAELYDLLDYSGFEERDREYFG
jgi:methylisocitrate lyase